MASTPAPSDFLAHYNHSHTALRALNNQVSGASNWQDKYRALMLGGKAMLPLSPEWQTDAARVQGCESAAWLYHHQDGDRHFYIAGSEARIVTGLIALLLAACSGKDSQTIANFDANSYFAALGLGGQLSPSRANGLHALARRIQSLAAHNHTSAGETP